MAKQNIVEGDSSTPTGANRFSVYAKRNAASRIDWGTIADDLTTEIDKIDTARKEEKALIAKNTTESLGELAEVGDLNGRRLNEEVIGASNQSSEVLRISYDMLKSGAITPTEYKMIMQRQKNNYAELSSAAENYSKWFTEQQTRNKERSGSELEVEVAMGTAGFGNLNDKKFWVDPISGSIMLVTMQLDEDGNRNVMPSYKDNPEFFQNVSSINNRYNFKEDRKILSEETAKLVNPLADNISSTVSRITALEGGGVVTSTADLRQDKNFNQIIVDNIGSLTATGNDVGQILLGQTIGEGYKLAQSLEEFRQKHPDLDEKYFLKYSMKDGVSIIDPTDAQEKEARKRAEISLESQIDRIVKQTAPKGAQQDNASTSGSSAREKEQFGYLQDIEKIVSGDINQSDSGYRRLIDTYNRNADPENRISEFIIDADEIFIKRANGKILPISRRSANLDADGIQIVDDPNTKNIDEAFSSTSELDEILGIYEAVTGVRMSTAEAQSILDNNNFKIRPKNTEFRGMRVARNPYPVLSGAEENPGLDGMTVKGYLIDKLKKTTKGNLNSTVKKAIITAVDESVPGKISTILTKQGFPTISSTYELIEEEFEDGDKSYVQFKLGDTTVKILIYDESKRGDEKDVSTSVIAGKIQDGINGWIEGENIKQLDTAPEQRITFKDWKEFSPDNITFAEYKRQRENQTILKYTSEAYIEGGKTEAEKNKEKREEANRKNQ